MADSNLTATVRHEVEKAIIDLVGEINTFAEDPLMEAFNLVEESKHLLIYETRDQTNLAVQKLKQVIKLDSSYA